MGDLGYLFAACVVVWVGIVAYVWSLSTRQRAIERELVALRTERKVGSEDRPQHL